MNWNGVIPAITTPFHEDLSIDHVLLGRHVRWLVDNGCRGVVALGSLGEGATLTPAEKRDVLSTCLAALEGRAPVVAGISSLSTAEAVGVARQAADLGCSGLMVLPPYVYSTDWREMKAHVDAVLRATNLPCMLYNNPIAYKTDYVPEQIAELAEGHKNLQAVKESSADVRRVTALRALLGDRLEISVGVDDMIVEGVQAGARGWIAGVVNALPRESVAIFELAMRGDFARAQQIYRWMLPLLRMDTVPKFVQLIKLIQQEAEMGSERVRPPRLTLAGTERETALREIRAALSTRPNV